MRSRPDDAGPNEPDRDPSPLVQCVLASMEAFDLPQSLVDDVVRLIEKWERSQEAETPEDVEARYGE